MSFSNVTDTVSNVASAASTGAAIGSIIPGAGTLIGGGIGAIMGMFSGSDDEKRRAAEAYVAELEGMGVPNPMDFVSKYGVVDTNDVKTFQPLLEKEIAQGPTAYEQIQLDPNLKKAQMEALTRMQRQAEVGMTPEEEMQANQITRQAGAGVKSAQENVLQEMARRGTLGGGAELQAKMANATAGYDQAGQQSLGLLAERNKRALQAALSGGQMAGNMEQADYGRQADLARAKDVISQFNVQNQLGVGSRNVASQNRAGESALDRQRRLEDEKRNLANRQADQLSGGTVASIDAANKKKQAIAEGRLKAGGIEAESKENVATGIGKIATGIGSAVDAFGLAEAKNEEKKRLGMV